MQYNKSMLQYNSVDFWVDFLNCSKFYVASEDDFYRWEVSSKEVFKRAFLYTLNYTVCTSNLETSEKSMLIII